MSARKKAVLITIAILGLAFCGLIYAVSPKYKTATDAEIRALIDPRLLEPLSNPPGGAERYAKLTIAAEQAVKKGRTTARIPGMPPVSSSVATTPPQPELDRTDPNVKNLIEILASGPLYRVSKDPFGPDAFPNFAAFKDLTKQAAFAARTHAKKGQWSEAQKDLQFGYLLLHRLSESETSIIDFLVTIAMQAILDRAAFDIGQLPKLPLSFAKGVLQMLPTTDSITLSNQLAIRGEFQMFSLPRLGDPWKWTDSMTPETDMFGNPAEGRNQHYGSYNAIASAKLENAFYIEIFENSARKKKDVKAVAQTLADDAGKGLPEPPVDHDLSGTEGELTWRWYTYRMNLIPNSLGKLNVSSIAMFQLTDGTLRSKTGLERTRAVYAAALYKAQTGKPATSFQEIVRARILKEAPYDFETDKPLSFNVSTLATWPTGIP